jgi:DNA-binding response OmpR family regulator
MPHEPLRDPIKGLQVAAHAAALHVSPGNPARQVVVLDATGARLLTLAVPPGIDVSDESAEFFKSIAGWTVTDREARFDGRPVPVGPSRLKLLKVLAAATTPLTAKELAKLALDPQADEESCRYHIRELRKELAKVFSGFEGEIVTNAGDGYRLVLR